MKVLLSVLLRSSLFLLAIIISNRCRCNEHKSQADAISVSKNVITDTANNITYQKQSKELEPKVTDLVLKNNPETEVSDNKNIKPKIESPQHPTLRISNKLTENAKKEEQNRKFESLKKDIEKDLGLIKAFRDLLSELNTKATNLHYTTTRILEFANEKNKYLRSQYKNIDAKWRNLKKENMNEACLLEAEEIKKGLTTIISDCQIKTLIKKLQDQKDFEKSCSKLLEIKTCLEEFDSLLAKIEKKKESGKKQKKLQTLYESIKQNKENLNLTSDIKTKLKNIDRISLKELPKKQIEQIGRDIQKYIEEEKQIKTLTKQMKKLLTTYDNSN